MQRRTSSGEGSSTTSAQSYFFRNFVRNEFFGEWAKMGRPEIKKGIVRVGKIVSYSAWEYPQ